MNILNTNNVYNTIYKLCIVLLSIKKLHRAYLYGYTSCCLKINLIFSRLVLLQCTLPGYWI